MNNQGSVNQLLNNFSQQGVVRKQASFFGQPLSTVPGGTAGSASPVAQMLTAFTVAGRTLAEPSFFGVRISEYTNRPSASQHTANAPIPLPQRQRNELARAA